MIQKNFNSTTELLKAFSSEELCIEYLERLRWHGQIISPFDPSSTVYKCQGNKYRCRNTGKYFNVRTGTVFASSKTSLQKWFIIIWYAVTYKDEASPAQLAKEIKVMEKTAALMLQRIKEYLAA